VSSAPDWISRFKVDPRRSGIFLDLDGTISEIASTPSEARLHKRAAGLLSDLARRYPMCVMSGRRAGEVASLVGLPHIHYVGVHGMEWIEDEPRIDPEVLPHLPTLDRAREELEAALSDLPGVTLEDKLASVSLHFRAAPGEEDAALQLAEGVALKLGLKVRRGRMTVELRPPVDIDKGTVLIRLAAGWRLKRALYAGDDLTDVDAFRGLRYLVKEGGFEGIAIAVLSPEVPIELEAVADLTVDGPNGLLDLLSNL
jgi:trehalose 6-phosphate phosphatase